MVLTGQNFTQDSRVMFSEKTQGWSLRNKPPRLNIQTTNCRYLFHCCWYHFHVYERSLTKATASGLLAYHKDWKQENIYRRDPPTSIMTAHTITQTGKKSRQRSILKAQHLNAALPQKRKYICDFGVKNHVFEFT